MSTEAAVYAVVSFTCLGTPVSRARKVTLSGRHTFMPPATTSWYGSIRKAWQDAGAIRLPDAPLALEVVAHFARPPGHFGARGKLSAAGRRAIPGGTRDVDSVTVSAVMDALNGLAWTDDRFFVHAQGSKRWCAAGEPERLTVLAWHPVSDDVARP